MVLNQGWAQVGLASFLLPLHTHLSTVKSLWRLLKVGHSPRKLFATFHQFFGSRSVLWRMSPQRVAVSKVGHHLPAVVTGLSGDSLATFLCHSCWFMWSWLLPQPLLLCCRGSVLGFLCGAVLGKWYLQLQLNIAIPRTW